MNAKEISFENLPKAVAFLNEQITELKVFLMETSKKETLSLENKRPIGIEEVSKIIGKAKPTIYALVRKRKIPVYKQGKNLYFYEEELLNWISEGKRKTIMEIENSANTFLKK